MNGTTAKMLKKLALVAIPSAFALAGCTTEIDEDAFRAGAIEMKIDEVTSDEIYPTAGDEIDWKMVFVPTPGDITVNTFWDDPAAVFNVVVGIYDRFGIPIETIRRDTAADKLEVTAFTPESGLHYVKVEAESGHSIYSINIKFETNDEGFVALTQAPSYSVYNDFEGTAAANAKKMQANPPAAPSTPGAVSFGGGNSGGGNGGGSAGGNGGGSAGGNGGGEGEDGAEGGGQNQGVAPGAVLPTVGAGGAVLPTGATGGISSPGGSSGPTVVRDSGGGGGYAASDVRTINNKTSAVSNEKSAVKPIVGDLKGRYKTVNAEIKSISSKKQGAQIKISVGRADGVRDGSIGELYVDGQLLEGGRFKITSILDNSSIAVTNASSKDVKKASKVVVKIPE